MEGFGLGEKSPLFKQKGQLSLTFFFDCDPAEPMPRKELIEKLCLEMNCRERTVEARLKSIIVQKFDIPNTENRERHLCKRTENREIIYYLSD